MNEQKYHWVIEWVPEEQDFVGCEHAMIGTQREAKDEAESKHPGYLCREIVFHRCGEVRI